MEPADAQKHRFVDVCDVRLLVHCPCEWRPCHGVHMVHQVHLLTARPFTESVPVLLFGVTSSCP